MGPFAQGGGQAQQMGGLLGNLFQNGGMGKNLLNQAMPGQAGTPAPGAPDQSGPQMGMLSSLLQKLQGGGAPAAPDQAANMPSLTALSGLW